MKIRQTTEKDGNCLFLQWYPEDEYTCFISTGNSIFNNAIIKYYGDMSRPAPIDDGELRIWVKPEVGMKYVIGVDSADPDKDNPVKGDHQVAVVLNHRLQHVATLRCKVDTNVFASKVSRLGHMYNDAYLVVERNNMGHATILALEQIERYPFMFKTGNKVGWIATQGSKIHLIGTMRESLGALGLTTYDALLVQELRTFRKTEKGFGAKPGNHDDLVMALGMAMVGYNTPEFIALATQGTINNVSRSYGWAAAGE